MTVALVLGVCAVMAGCGSGPAAVKAPGQKSGLPPIGSSHASLSELLTKPRAELAKEFDELMAQVQIREKAHRDGTLAFGLLPRLRLPLVLPVWAEASYSAKSEISLPPYVAEGSTDNHLALHLAHFGDAEAARRLADSNDRATRQSLNDLACKRNYPAEWTRLAALLLHAAEYRVAVGDDDGRAELASLHKQIRELLDAKAARGPLGAALLAQGHKVLTLAASTWREQGQPELADRADADLAAWGEFPAPAVPVPLGASSAAVADLLRSTGKGRVVPALNIGRALDLLALPATGEGVQGVIATFDAADKLAEVLVVYRPRIADYYLEPAHLVPALEDHGIAGTDRAQAASVHRRDYTFGSLACGVAVAPRGYLLGAYVRFAAATGAARAPALVRDFGVVNLDRSFAQNRVRLVPEQIGDEVQTTRASVLGRIASPLLPLVPTEAVLRRDGWHDLVQSFTLLYGVDEETPALLQTVLPLWSALGPGGLDSVEGKDGGQLVFRWEDERTRYVLRLPHLSGQPFEFVAADTRVGEALAARATAVEAFDAGERKTRLEKNQPLLRIPRKLDVGWSSSPNFVQLGMTRKQALGALPRGQAVLKQQGADVVNVVLTGEPPSTAVRVPRQVFVRFGPNQRVAEVRVRYFDGPASKGTSRWTAELLAGLSKPCGAATESPGSWSALWSDLPHRKPTPSLARWQDDVTVLTFQRDGTGAEAILRDCPLNQPAGVALAPLAYLPRGLEGIALGEERATLLGRWKIDKPRTLEDGALVLPPVPSGSYDAVLVWFEQDKIARIAARHGLLATGAQPSPSPSDQVAQAWGRSIRSLGWPSRQDVTSEGALQSLGWHDDQTRVRIFWQEADGSAPRVFTEWKDVTVAKGK
jgi:hypothetical protein